MLPSRKASNIVYRPANERRSVRPGGAGAPGRPRVVAESDGGAARSPGERSRNNLDTGTAERFCDLRLRWCRIADRGGGGRRRADVQRERPHFNALGESIGIVTVPEDAVEPLRANEVLSVRPLAIAG